MAESCLINPNPSNPRAMAMQFINPCQIIINNDQIMSEKSENMKTRKPENFLSAVSGNRKQQK